jgi:hypothetical protein
MSDGRVHFQVRVHKIKFFSMIDLYCNVWYILGIQSTTIDRLGGLGGGIPPKQNLLGSTAAYAVSLWLRRAALIEARSSGGIGGGLNVRDLEDLNSCSDARRGHGGRGGGRPVDVVDSRRSGGGNTRGAENVGD